MAIRATDQITVTDVSDAYNVILTSEAYTFVGGTSGATSGSCTTDAVAYQGSNLCSTVTIDASEIIVPTGISATVSNSGSSKVTVTFSITATISSACEATIPVVVDGITINKKFSFAVAKTGSTGKGIKSTAITYQKSSSGTTVPTGTWVSQSSMPSLSAGEFLWSRTVITYTDNTTSTSYSVGMAGATGAKGDTGATGATGATGNGVQSAVSTYQKSSSGTSVPTGTWLAQSSIPSLSAGEYLWSRTITTYTDGTTSTAYSVGMAGKTGSKGDKGEAGDDAITMSITSSNGTVFKNNAGSTVLTAHVFQGGVEKSITTAGVVADSLGNVKWYKGTSTTAVATANTLTVSASDVTNAEAYTCQLEG